jgi:CBS domain containing-hemolysin-like protein
VEPDQLTVESLAWRLSAVLALVLANAFFVAAEFALVGARRTKLDQMAAAGDRGARSAQQAVRHLDRYLSGTQLGITLASLGLGWIGEPALAGMIDVALAKVGIDAPPGATHTAAAVATAFLVITFLHIVLGELAPKSLALFKPEGVSRWVARPLILFSRVMWPFIWSLNGTANAFLRLFGVTPPREGAHAHSADELRLLVMQAHAHGTLDESDSAMLAGVFDFHEKKARDVMQPRTKITAVSQDSDEDEVRDIVRRERYSRYPVYRETLDDIVGVFLAKDLWLYEGDGPFELKKHLREPLYIPEGRPAERVLDDLRKYKEHMAVVIDEYGGTAGIVTLEDLVEEVVGDIADEYDFASRPSVEVGGVLELDGSLSLVDVRSDYRVDIPEGDWATLGGYVFATLQRIPEIGDRVSIPGGELEVVGMDGRRVVAVRVHRHARAERNPLEE